MSDITIIKPKELPIRTALDGTEFNVVYADDNDRLERVLVTSSGNFITIGDTVFRRQVGYTLGVKNGGVNLEINDIISNGIIVNSGFTIDIVSAVYTGGTITDFGTYNDTTKDFSGGSYDIIEFNVL